MIVQKFGGASVACSGTIQKTARHVAEAYEAGESVAVVVSAMQGVTDQLETYVEDLTLVPSRQERDTVLSAGEQITCGLMALALRNLGLKAVSWLAWQIPIRVDTSSGIARIHSLQTEKLKAFLSEGGIPVIAGFQGIDADERLITLGRGGSDITAVALAASLRAQRCDFFKDVPGVMTADPLLVPEAQVLEKVSLSELLELSALGSKVIQTRAVELAATQGVPLRILSNFEKGNGTTFYHEEITVEKPLVRSLVCQHHQGQMQVFLKSSPDCSRLVELMKTSHIPFDMLMLVTKEEGALDVTFCLAQEDLTRAVTLLKTHFSLQEESLKPTPRLAKLSLIGVGLQGHSDILATLFKTLSSQNISVRATCTSQCRISFLVEEAFAELSLRLLHKVFNLEKGFSNDDTPASP